MVQIHIPQSFDELLNTDWPLYKQEGWQQPSGEFNIPYLLLTVAFSLAVFLFEAYLDSRQLYNFKNIKKLPPLLEKVVPHDKFEKSNLYCYDKTSFGRFEGTILMIEGLLLVFFGWMPFAWDIARDLAGQWGLLTWATSDIGQEIVITSIFVFILVCHDTIISLPFALYSTFVVEERHGFNKMTLSLFFRDKALGLLLTAVIGMPVLSAIIWLIRWGGPHFYFYVWIFMLVFSLIMMTIYPTLIAPLFNKYTPLEDGEIKTAIENLAQRVQFPLTKVFVVDGSKRSSHSNAYFYGFFKSKRIVLFDTLMKQVEQPELLAILGHEIGHWRLWHTIQGFVISQVYVFALFLSFSYVQNTPNLFLSFGFAYNPNVAMPVLIGLTLFTQTVWSPIDKILHLLLNINSRNNEFAADRYSKDLGMGEALASGLVKISIENLGNMVPDWMYSTYHFSHPPLVERLSAIQAGKSKSN